MRCKDVGSRWGLKMWVVDGVVKRKGLKKMLLYYREQRNG
jgi:hypothetical protein